MLDNLTKQVHGPQSIKAQEVFMKRHFRYWGAVWLLVALWLGSWIGQGVFQWSEYVSTQQDHNAPIQISEFVAEFMSATLENWQSEWLQLIYQAIFILGFKHMFFKIDAEDLERIEQKLDEVLDRLHRDGGK